MENKKKIHVAITYSHDSEAFKIEVHKLCASLRKPYGFDAVMDVIKRQESTSLNFTKMEHEFFTNYDKVIVVLSEGYKQKAENFKGGVGNEYLMLLNDLKINPNKYVFVVFNEISIIDKIPIALKGIDYVNLSKNEDWNLLNSKLQDVPTHIFPETSEDLIPVMTQEIKPSAFENNLNFEIFDLEGRGCSIGGKYTYLNLFLRLKVSNNNIDFLEKVLVQFYALEDFFERSDYIKNLETKKEIALFHGQEEIIILPSINIHRGNCHRFFSEVFAVFLFSKLGKQELELDFNKITLKDEFGDRFLNINDFKND